jgi:predicted enzyme related to lactoylglutathione lyase
MVVKSIVHFEIPAEDVERLSKFYSDVFGWKFQKTPPMGGMEYWMIQTGPRNKSVGGGMYKKMGVPNEGPRNYIGVDEIDGAIASFTSAGGRQLVEKQEVPGFGWSYMGLDPEGNVVGLFEAASRRQASRPKRATRKKSKSRR